MRSVPILIHLSIHKVSFQVNFPATLSLELQVDKCPKEIMKDIPLGKQILNINRDINYESQINYNQSTKTYSDKKISVVIYIKTKTSQSQLTAGILSIPVCKPGERIITLFGKLTRCNDPKAFIQYSLRTQTLLKGKANQDANREIFDSKSEKNQHKYESNKFKSAVNYFNNQRANEQEIQQNSDSLQDYLNSSLRKSIIKDRRKYKSSQKLKQIREDEQTKTEKFSYKKDILSESINQNHLYEAKFKEMSRKSQNLSKEIQSIRNHNDSFKSEIKQLKEKIKRYQAELEEKASIIHQMQKKWEMKDNLLFDENKIVKNKLQLAESQLHQQLYEKNSILVQKQSKEQQLLQSFKQKEKIINQQKKKIQFELQLKQSKLVQLQANFQNLQLKLNEFQVKIDSLSFEQQKYLQQIEQLNNKTQTLNIQLISKKQDIKTLQQQVTQKDKIINEMKTQKKMIFQLKQERDQKDLNIKQNYNSIQECKIKIEEMKEVLKSKTILMNTLTKQNQQLKKKMEADNLKQLQMVEKIKQYKKDVEKQSQKSNKITKQIKEIQDELGHMKRQANNTMTQKQRIAQQSEKLIDIFKEKMIIMNQDNLDQQKKYQCLNQLYKSKEDQTYQLGQQLIKCKDQLANFTQQLQTLRQDNTYLNNSLKELSQKQQKIYHLEQKLQYNQKFMDQLEQNFHLSQIQLKNQINYLQEKKEERQQQNKELKQCIDKLNRDNLQLSDQIEILKKALNNKTNELNFLKIQNDKSWQNNIQFEQKMIMLKRSEQNSMTSMEDLREQNIHLKKIVKQNQEVVIILGKKYDSLLKNTIQSLTKFDQIMKSPQNIVNRSVKHEKVEVSTILNDCIRMIGHERQNHQQQIAKSIKQLHQLKDKNHQNLKIIKIKAQIQAELEQEFGKIKNNKQILETKIIQLQNQITLHLRAIDERIQDIQLLHVEINKINKLHQQQIRNHQENGKKLEENIEKLKQQMKDQSQKQKIALEVVKNNSLARQSQLNQKINELHLKNKEIQGNLRTEKQIQKQMKSTITKLQASLAKLASEKEDIQSEIDKRTKQLIAIRIQSENRSKLIKERENQISQFKKKVEKLESSILQLQKRNIHLGQGNQALNIKKIENQKIIKQKNSQILGLKLRVTQLEDQKEKITTQKLQLTKSKYTQQALNASLNQNIKSLKESIIQNEQKINKLTLEKDASDKDYNKKINVLTNHKNNLEKQHNDLRLKCNQKQTEQTQKQKSLTNQLRQTKIVINQYQSAISNLKKEIQNHSSKIAQLSSEITTKAQEFQTKQKTLFPNDKKIKEIINSINDLRNIGKDFETSKNKLLRLSVKTQKYPTGQSDELIREMNIAVNRFKIQILNKHIPQQTKTIFLEGVRDLQVIIQKITKNSIF